MGRLERKLDQDLIAKMENGWRPKERVEPMKAVKPTRKAESYRGARRNAVLREDKGIWRGAPFIRGGYYVKPTKTYPYASKRQNSRYANA